MDKVNSPVGWWLRAISWVPGDGAVVQPSQNAVEPADFSFGGRVRVLGLPGVHHAADGVGRMLGLAPNGLDTLDAVRLDDAVRRRTLYRGLGSPATALLGTVTSTCGNGGSPPPCRGLFDAREPSRGPSGGRWRPLSLRSSRSTGRSAARCQTARQRRHRARRR